MEIYSEKQIIISTLKKGYFISLKKYFPSKQTFHFLNRKKENKFSMHQKIFKIFLQKKNI